MGKIYVPETENEEAHLVDGVHQAIVPSDLFWKVQKLLNKRMETHSHLCSKEKLRDELPLRGLLKDLTWYFQEAGLEAKRKLLGSIFLAKLTYQDGKYRTDGLNPALAIILQKSKWLQNEKTGNIIISENVSGDVPKAGVEPTTFALRMPFLSILTAMNST